MAVTYLGIIVVTLLLVWSTKRHQRPPSEMLKLRLEQYSRGAEPEMALIDGRALTMWRKSILALMGFALIFPKKAPANAGAIRTVRLLPIRMD